MSIVVQRSGVTTKPVLTSGKMPGPTPKKAVQCRFTMASKGGGTSDVQISISPREFADLAEAMFEADPNEAIKAFGHALKDGI